VSDQTHLEILRRGPRAWNAWRTENPAAAANLNGISLKLGERQMGPINGGPINLSGAQLRAAKLRYASLLSANLEGAELADADLTHARLDGANLAGANLSNAALDHADMSAANLSGANLSGASLLEVRNLSQKQLDASLGDGTTLLPPRLARPARWPGASTARPSVERAPVARPQTYAATASQPRRARTRSLVRLAIIMLLCADAALIYILNTQDADVTGSVDSREANHGEIAGKTTPAIPAETQESREAGDGGLAGNTAPAIPAETRESRNAGDGELAGKTAPAIPLEPRDTDRRAPNLIPPSTATPDLVGDAAVPTQETARHGTDPERGSLAAETPLLSVEKTDPPVGDERPAALASVEPPTVPAAPQAPDTATAALPQDDLRVTTVPDALDPPPPLPSRKPAAESLAAIPVGPQARGIKALPTKPAMPSTPRKTPEAAGRAAVSDVLAGGL